MSSVNTDKPVILVVDDSKVIRRAAAKMLGANYVVLEAVDGEEGWQLIQQNAAISVVFTDMQMPEMNGLELLAHIRGADDERITGLPVIMITGQSDSESAKKQVFEKGATDFISKPFDSIDLLSRAESYARLNRKVVELEKQTGYDKLTGLFNTSNFNEQGAKALSFSLRHKLNVSVALLEIMDFQNLYIKHGKAVAQQIIIAVGKRLGENMRNEDVAARIGVARFALLMPLTNAANSLAVIARLREAINKLVFDTSKDKIRVALAAGMTSAALDMTDGFDVLVSQADTALARAMQGKDETVASFAKAQRPAEIEVTQAQMEQAFMHIMQGNYYQIPEHHLQAVMARLSPFLQYVANQNESSPLNQAG